MREFLKRCIAVVALLICTHFVTMAQTGSSCGDAIPISGNYQQSIQTAGDLWFTAWSYDLPLSLSFTPADASCPAPMVEMDFTCTPGVYEDSVLNHWFGPQSSLKFIMPYIMTMEVLENSNPKQYVLSLPASHRDQLARVGITYNIQAYVKVSFPGMGSAEIKADTVYSTCMTGGDLMRLGDSAKIEANNDEPYRIVPFSTFRKDSIRYVWHGTQAATIWIKKDCADKDDPESPIIDTWTMQPGDTFKLSELQVRAKDNSYENQGVKGGLCYLHVLSPADGTLYLQRVPIAPPQNNAIRLEFGKTYSANSDKLYFFSKKWYEAMKFVTNTGYRMNAYISSSGFFNVTDNPMKGLIDSLSFYPIEDGHELGLGETDMAYITQKAVDDYIYIRFKTNDPKATVTLWEWDGRTCASAATKNLRIPSTISISTSNVDYRIRYSTIAGGELTLQNSATKRPISAKFSSNCTFANSAENPNVVLKDTNVPAKGTIIITQEDIASWAQYVDDEGYIYVRFKGGQNCFLTINTTAPPEQDPEPPDDPEPECEKTIHAAVSAATPHGSVSILLN